jgi:hypothetical protein
MEDETCIILPQLVECLDAGWHMILLGTSSLHSDRRMGFLLVVDHTKWPTASEALQHPYLKSLGAPEYM